MRIERFLVLFSGVSLNRRIKVSQIKDSLSSPKDLLVFRFTEHALPMHTYTSNIIVKSNTSIKYRRRVTRSTHLDSEHSVCVGVVGSYAGTSAASEEGKESSPYVYKKILDRPILPDYTTPYLVFGLCAGVLVGITSSFSKVLLNIS
ncbi:hypothetical protein NEFER03_1847 [Nematocida sp. LUAm3]|nr:hypothetical protein NEFER03_1847 [Nematocida sp. LUAm3]KAI5174003.1 hypothetical protein NEFER02_0470 [Nematocida sp. LUAm2]KAI5177253.1 hypothetical protein NEFER01_0528 [Nematocida sp. LUAm1]